MKAAPWGRRGRPLGRALRAGLRARGTSREGIDNEMSIQRTRAVAAGVTAAWLVVLASAGATTAFAGGNQGPVWTHASGSENWIGKVVSIGNEGTQVFAALGTLNSHARIFCESDANPPTPIVEYQQPNFAYDHAVDSAACADVHAHLHYETADIYVPNTPVLRRFRSTESQPEWSWSFPFQVNHPNGGVAVSDDGEVVVGWVYDQSSSSTAVAAFVGASGDPVRYQTLVTYGEPKAVRMSGDGSLLYIASMVKTIVYAPLANQVVHEHINWDGIGNGHAFSGDGSVFAQVIPPNRIRVYERQGSGFIERLTYQGEGPTICGHLDLSADGSLLGATFDYTDTWLRVRILAFDLSQQNAPIVLDDSTIGAGTLTNLASDLSVAANGSAIGVGLWGDELGLAPEVRAYRRSPAGDWRLVATHELPGSVNDVDMAPDGHSLAVASKGIHANLIGGGGRIDLFEVGDPDFVLQGVPSGGGTVNFVQKTTPGARGRVLFAPRLEEAPLPFPGIGTLYLDRHSIGMLPTGTADDDGLIVTPFEVPGGASMIGTSIYFQGLGLSPRSFSDNWIKLTILP